MAYPADVERRGAGMNDDALGAHVVEQLAIAQRDARAMNRDLVAMTCVGLLGEHVHDDARTAQVVARALCRTDADLGVILPDANDCARVVMDCGVRVAVEIDLE
ncbi:LamB/YcsF family protein [Pigmentiphaga litoralis]